MSFCGHCKVLWWSLEDIQRKAAFVRTVFPVPSAPGFYNKREGAKSLSSCVLVNNKTALAPCAGDWGHSLPLLMRQRSVTLFLRWVSWGPESYTLFQAAQARFGFQVCLASNLFLVLERKLPSKYFVYWEYVLVSTFEPAGSEHAIMLSF